MSMSDTTMSLDLCVILWWWRCFATAKQECRLCIDIFFGSNDNVENLVLDSYAFHLLDSCYSMATFTQNLVFLFLLAQVGNIILHTLWCMLQCEQLSAQANAKLHAILRRRGSHFGMWVPDCCLTYGCANGVLTSRMARGASIFHEDCYSRFELLSKLLLPFLFWILNSCCS